MNLGASKTKKIAAQTRRGEDLNLMMAFTRFASCPQGSCGVINHFMVDDNVLSC